jgi:hypothetical protein
MEVRRLIRTVCGGRGFRSKPAGELQDVDGLAFSFTFNLHLLRFLPGAQDQFRVVEQPIHDVHVTFHPVIHHLLFAVASQNDKHRSLTVFDAMRNLYEGLLAVIEHADGLQRFVLAFDL